jgi:V8-like Glu-specific endopeptidase
VRLRAGRPDGRYAAARGDGEQRPADDGAPRKRPRWFSRPPARAALISVLAISVVVTFTSADGTVGGIASGFARVMGHTVAPAQSGQDFAGTPAVGALFTMAAGKLGRHFCTASVVNSPGGDLVVTAAHCVTGTSGGIAFVPGYDNGSTPYGTWSVTRVYVDRSWSSESDPDDDFAFLQVSQPGSIVPIQDMTGAERLGTGTPTRQLVDVIGYPDSSNVPITCRNWTRQPMSDQLEFDCGGYTDGTSGGPFLARVDPTTGQGTVIGVIGGYEQGGFTPQVSYSSMFGANVAALYQTAVAGG